MVTFDAALPGTSPDVWERSERLASVPPLALDGVDALVVVAAHPDDETLGAGGIIRRCAASGMPVHIVVASDGAASHPHSSVLAPADLVLLRAEETDAALARLAPHATVHRLGLPDGALRENRDALRAGVDAVLIAVGGHPAVLSTWTGDGHRDHRIVGEVCGELCRARDAELLEYPVWMWHWATPQTAEVPWRRARLARLSVDEVEAKAAAIEAYRSQTQPLSSAPGDEAVLGPALLARARADTELVFAADELDGYFDGLYARHDDPWGYDTRWYERRKRALSVAVLRRERYGRVLELGCSTGALTVELAERADGVIAMDAAPAAVERARARSAGHREVTVVRGDVRDGLPSGRFDLVVMSELGYYLEEDELDDVLAAVVRGLTERGELLVCHWRHASSTFRLTAERVHDRVAALGLHRQVHHEEPDLLLELYSVDASSAARLEGLA